MNEQTCILGVALTVTFEPTEKELQSPDFVPRTEEIRVRNIPVAKYEEAARQLDAENEVAFTGVAVSRDRKWVESLTPGSFDELAAAVQAANKFFFASYGRRIGNRMGIEMARASVRDAARAGTQGD